jgi:hypothetical protein
MLLHEFIATNREEIITRTREKVAVRATPRSALDELNHGVPLFLSQIVETLRLSGDDGAAKGESACFAVGQVAHGYGDVCQAVTELAEEKKARIAIEEFHTFNQCLDQAIGRAVTEYVRQHELTIDGAGTERLRNLSEELRNILSGALLAFDILERGNVSVCSATGTMLGRSLIRLRDIVDRSLAAEDRRMLALRQEGHTLKEIGTALGRSPSFAFERLHELGRERAPGRFGLETAQAEGPEERDGLHTD